MRHTALTLWHYVL